MGSLETLDLSNCPRIIELPGNMNDLTNLKYLILKGLTEVVKFPIINKLKSLENLLIDECKIENFSENIFGSSMQNLKKLSFIGCRFVKTLPALDYLRNLSTLIIISCSELEVIPNVPITYCEEVSKLSVFHVSFCPKLRGYIYITAINIYYYHKYIYSIHLFISLFFNTRRAARHIRFS